MGGFLCFPVASSGRNGKELRFSALKGAVILSTLRERADEANKQGAFRTVDDVMVGLDNCGRFVSVLWGSFCLAGGFCFVISWGLALLFFSCRRRVETEVQTGGHPFVLRQWTRPIVGTMLAIKLMSLLIKFVEDCGFCLFCCYLDSAWYRTACSTFLIQGCLEPVQVVLV